MEIEARKLTVASGKMQNGMYAKQNRRFIENRGEEAYGEKVEKLRWNLCEAKLRPMESMRAKSRLFKICSFGIWASQEFSRYVRMESERTENFPDMTKWNLSEAIFQVGI